MAKFDPAIALVLRHEGGFVSDIGDEGGATNFGISLRFYRKNIKVDGTSEDIRRLTADQAMEIYRKFFWDRNRYEELDNQSVANRMLDLAVNIGGGNANMLLQQAINDLSPGEHLMLDGTMGAKTIAHANVCNATSLYDGLIDKAQVYYERIATHGENHRFLHGWLNRLTC